MKKEGGVMESKRKEGAAIQTKVGRLLKITRFSGLAIFLIN